MLIESRNTRLSRCFCVQIALFALSTPFALSADWLSRIDCEMRARNRAEVAPNTHTDRLTQKTNKSFARPIGADQPSR